MRTHTSSCAVAVLVLALSGTPAHAASGELDSTFGRDGKVITHVSRGGGFDVAYGVALQGDKIVAVGEAQNTFAVVRYNEDGALDESFGRGGMAIPAYVGRDTAYAVTVQPDQKIIAVGIANNADFAVLRFTADGQQDRTFEDDGISITDFGGGTDIAYAVTAQPDGKIIAAGVAGFGGVHDFALARYKPDGGLDTSFGTGGKVVTARTSVDTIYGVVMQGEKIVVAGGSGDSLTVARYDSAGRLDATFGEGGIAKAGEGTAYSVAVQGEKVLIAGRADGSTDGSFVVARLNGAGELDQSFGGNGMAVTPTSSKQDTAWSMVLQDDKIIVAGVAGKSFGLARYSADGELDKTFGEGGTVLTNFTDETDSAYAVALHPDGKLVAAGAANQYLDAGDFALARYEL